jgi:hypothetical protein
MLCYTFQVFFVRQKPLGINADDPPDNKKSYFPFSKNS